MDLVALNKKAFLIPTPGQFEQEYLAKRLKKAGFFPYAKQSQFTLEHLLEVDLYKTPFSGEKTQNWKNLLCLFDREWKLGTLSFFTFYINFLFVGLNNVFYNWQA